MQFSLQERGITPYLNKSEMYHTIIKFHQAIESYADVYVNDAFRFAHLGHEMFTPLYHKTRVAGLNLYIEHCSLHVSFEVPSRSSLLFIIGGNQVAEKLKKISHVIELSKDIIIGGSVALTTLKETAQMQLGSSSYGRECSETVRNLVEKAEKHNVRLHLPVDFVCKSTANFSIATMTVEDGVMPGNKAVDISYDSIFKFHEIIQQSSNIVWNGPMGVIEKEDCQHGSRSILSSMLQACERRNARITAIGDNTTNFIKTFSDINKFAYTSTECVVQQYLMGNELPGIDMLLSKQF